MPATQNDTINDKGELTVTITAEGALATGLPAGTYDMQIVQRSFQPQSEPARQTQDTQVTGGTITAISDVRGNYVYTLNILDDFVKGETGELGVAPDQFTAVELFWEHWINKAPLGELTISPAGSETGMKEYTITESHVLSMSGPSNNADATAPAERTVAIHFRRDAMTIGDHA